MFDIDAGCFCEYFAYEVAGSMDVEAAGYQRQTELLVHACPSPSKGGGWVLLVFQVFPV